VVACRVRQLARQHVGADDREARTEAAQRRGAAAGAAEQRHPSVRPAVHVDLAEQDTGMTHEQWMQARNRRDLGV
jgi:hypothetical protein